MAHSMQREIGAVRIVKAPKRWCCVKAKGRSCDLAELGTTARCTVIAKADEALIKGGAPQRREQESIVDVEPLLVAAVCPRHDVRSAQQCGIGNTSERAAATPVVHERIAEYVLADALDHQPLDLCCSREVSGLGLEARDQRRSLFRLVAKA
jgi:hypothetical protein